MLKKKISFSISIANTVCSIECDNEMLSTYFQEEYYVLTSKNQPAFTIQLQANAGKDSFLVKKTKTTGTLYYSSPLVNNDMVNFFTRSFIQYFLTERETLLLHASSCIKNGMAYLFSGPSGAGKSTIIRFFPPTSILSNDTAIIRKEGDRFFAYTSPFDKKEQPNLRMMRAPIDKIFFLHQSQKTILEKNSVSESIIHLLPMNILFFNIANKIQKYYEHHLPPSTFLPKSDKKEITQLMQDLYRLNIEFLSNTSPYTLYFTRDLNFLSKL